MSAHKMTPASDKITLSEAGEFWEIYINGHATGILIDGKERATAMRRDDLLSVTYFMHTLDRTRWHRFKSEYERIAREKC